MKLSIRGNASINTDYFIPKIVLSTTELREKYHVAYYDHDGGEHYHWNEQHKAKSNRNLQWDTFHLEELGRLIFSHLSQSKQRTEIIRQRFQLLHPLLHSIWTKNPRFNGQTITNDIAEMYYRIIGINRLGQGKWERVTEPRYAVVPGEDEWAIILDARTMREIIDSGISNECLRCYSSGLRAIKRTAILRPDEEINEFSEYLLDGLPVHSSKQFIEYWFNLSAPVSREKSSLSPYRPKMEIEGDWHSRIN
jgi:hypothetical protein